MKARAKRGRKPRGHVRDTIEKKLTDLEERIRRELAEKLTQVQNASADHPTDLLDMAADGEIDYMSALSAEAGSATIETIERALEKLREGTYGVCEECGGAISRRRLKARPFAVLCIACKARREMDACGYGPDAIGAATRPGAHMNLNDEDINADESSLQEVFRTIGEAELSELF